MIQRGYAMQLINKVCVITGGANGIGRCLVRETAKQGAKVAFIDTDGRAGRKVLTELNTMGREALFYQGDISDHTTLETFIHEIIQSFGNVDYLINNACLSRRGILSGCGYDDFNYVLKVGVTAPYILAKLLMNHFSPNAAIVNIASTRAFMSQADTESYSAAKGGILALTHALAVSLAGKVRVNSISPGWIDVNASPTDTDAHSAADKNQHPVKRVGTPMDIVRAVLFLCNEDNGFITGENITIDGGMTKLMIYHQDHGWEYKG